MPIYEYACRNCAHTLEELQKISDEPLLLCPACGEPQLKRLLSAPRFRLKGSGWYETDFKKDKQKNLIKADGDAAAAGSKAEAADGGSSAKPDGDKGQPKSSAAESKSDPGKASARPAAAGKSSGKATESKTE